MKPISVVNGLLDRNILMMRTGNSESFRAGFTDNAFFIATDDSEVWSADKAAEKLAETEGKGWGLNFTQRECDWVCPGVVRFFERISHPKYGPMRSSGVCIQTEGGNYKIAHYILSCAVPNSALEGDKLQKYMELIGAAD